VTPAPVPTTASPPDPNAERAECLVPPPATPDRTTADSPATPRPLGVTNGSVEGADLIETHRRALSNHSYHLRAGRIAEVRALANARAFTYTGMLNGVPSIRVYGVGGTLYTLQSAEDGVAVRRSSYDPEAITDGSFLPSLSGSNWLENRVGVYEYDRVDTRRWNGTRVRVFRREFDTARQVVRRKVSNLESAVYVDDRGIIRYVDHDTKFVEVEHPTAPTEWHNATFAVTDVDTIRVRRPAAFCGPGRDPVEPAGTAERG
jgi:hypothetical protein